MRGAADRPCVVIIAIGLLWVLEAALVASASGRSPSLLDLGIAVAAGAAGAFAVNRADVSEVLPGVAVAIALVPPLSVTGLTLFAGSFEQVLGAALLFITNLVAVDAWLADANDISVSQLAVDGELVKVTVHGPGEPPSANDLHAALADALDRDVVLELRVVPEVLHVVGGDGP